jgi:hypothetical protein
MKRKGKVKPSESPVKLDIKVSVPEIQEYVAKAEIEVTQSKVKDMFFDAV